MIVLFWGDVDMCCVECGDVFIGLLNENMLVVIWNDVGYYS